MTKDLTCWYCHAAGMVPDPDLGDPWVKCPKCGATQNTTPRVVGRREVTIETLSGSTYDTKYSPRKKRLSRK